MKDEITQDIPKAYFAIDQATKESGFTMASDRKTCALLKTLASSKPGGKFLELGTGTGLSTAWILDGMDSESSLISFDNDDTFLDIARKYVGHDKRLSLVLSDGENWVKSNLDQTFDFIFADTWHGKYLLLEEVLNMLNKGGIYIVDDMLPQANWPDGHSEKADHFVKYLENRDDLTLTKLHWASGIILAVKK